MGLSSFLPKIGLTLNLTIFSKVMVFFSAAMLCSSECEVGTVVTGAITSPAVLAFTGGVNSSVGCVSFLTDVVRSTIGLGACDLMPFKRI